MLPVGRIFVSQLQMLRHGLSSPWDHGLCSLSLQQLQQLTLQLHRRPLIAGPITLIGLNGDRHVPPPPCARGWRMSSIVPSSPPSFHLNYLCRLELLPSPASDGFDGPGRHACRPSNPLPPQPPQFLSSLPSLVTTCLCCSHGPGFKSVTCVTESCEPHTGTRFAPESCCLSFLIWTTGKKVVPSAQG